MKSSIGCLLNVTRFFADHPVGPLPVEPTYLVFVQRGTSPAFACRGGPGRFREWSIATFFEIQAGLSGA